MASMSMSLHAVNHRLTNIPVKQLPPLASCLAASLSNCGELLSSPQSQKAAKSESDNAHQVHKLMARLTSLLNDRTPEGRWTAVVLVKAVVEAGQWEILRGCEPFVRGLMLILAKSDPVSTKKMCIITLTRIFHLTYQYPTLIREITTPSLPGFITSALNLVSVNPSSGNTRSLKPNTPFLEVVLHAFGELIARHPTIFRPFREQIQSILQTIIGATFPTFPEPVVDLAERLFILLRGCAPNNTSAEEWKKNCHMAILSVHDTAHQVFRAVVEQWESVDPTLRHSPKPLNYSQEMGTFEKDALGLSGWQGLDSGVNRLILLLRLLSRFLTTATASTVAIPIGSILDLTSRLTALTVPTDSKDVQANPQISLSERQALFTELPRIHVACVNLLSTLVGVLETGTASIAQTILEQTLWVFRAEKSIRQVRTSMYDLVSALLTHAGPSMTKQGVSSLTALFKSCCSEILPPVNEQPAAAKTTSSKSNQTTANADSFLNPNLKQGRGVDTSSTFPELRKAACDLLPAALTHLPIEYLSPALRAEIDRTIILTSEKEAMLASVLNPVPATQGRGVTASIIPFLARSYGADMEVEALIRPRMPVLMNTSGLAPYNDTDEDEEEEEPVLSAPQTVEDTGFLQPSATPILHQDLTNTIPAAKPPPVVSKRVHVDELAQAPAPSALKSEENVQTKKPRVGADVTATTRQPSLEQSSPATFSGTGAVSVSSTATTAAPPVQATAPPTVTSAPLSGTAAVAAAAGEDESDDELPALNIDPDTDDEDEDVAMAD
ncbi:rRNA processing/ribosome biogenesis-domain-containing protein [Aspergillus ambiguus]|uniref:RIX1/PELP1 family protein n=1 Tax=Aspergillus ambiguus TaxID=176160 RepID=UPI003CCC93CA